MEEPAVRRLLALLASDAHCHHRRAADALASAICALAGLGARLAVVAELFSAQFLLHPRWETRTAAALVVERVLTQDSALGECFLSAAAASGAAAQAASAAIDGEASSGISGCSSGSSGGGSCRARGSVGKGSDGSGLLLRLCEFDAVRTAKHGAPLRAMSDADSKYAFQSSLEAWVEARGGAAPSAAEVAAHAEAAAALARRELRRRIGFAAADDDDASLVRAGLGHLDRKPTMSRKRPRAGLQSLAVGPDDGGGDDSDGGEMPTLEVSDVSGAVSVAGGTGVYTPGAPPPPPLPPMEHKSTVYSTSYGSVVGISNGMTAAVLSAGGGSGGGGGHDNGSGGQDNSRGAGDSGGCGQDNESRGGEGEDSATAAATDAVAAVALGQLQAGLLDRSWFKRHGAAVGLVAVLRALRTHVDLRADSVKQPPPDFFGLFLEDLATRCLVVLTLDRFGDFSGARMVAPVRETAAQVLALAVAGFGGCGGLSWGVADALLSLSGLGRDSGRGSAQGKRGGGNGGGRSGGARGAPSSAEAASESEGSDGCFFWAARLTGFVALAYVIALLGDPTPERGHFGTVGKVSGSSRASGGGIPPDAAAAPSAAAAAAVAAASGAASAGAESWSADQRCRVCAAGLAGLHDEVDDVRGAAAKMLQAALPALSPPLQATILAQVAHVLRRGDNPDTNTASAAETEEEDDVTWCRTLLPEAVALDLVQLLAALLIATPSVALGAAAAAASAAPSLAESAARETAASSSGSSGDGTPAAARALLPWPLAAQLIAALAPYRRQDNTIGGGDNIIGGGGGPGGREEQGPAPPVSAAQAALRAAAHAATAALLPLLECPANSGGGATPRGGAPGAAPNVACSAGSGFAAPSEGSRAADGYSAWVADTAEALVLEVVQDMLLVRVPEGSRDNRPALLTAALTAAHARWCCGTAPRPLESSCTNHAERWDALWAAGLDLLLGPSAAVEDKPRLMAPTRVAFAARQAACQGLVASVLAATTAPHNAWPCACQQTCAQHVEERLRRLAGIARETPMVSAAAAGIFLWAADVECTGLLGIAWAKAAAAGANANASWGSGDNIALASVFVLPTQAHAPQPPLPLVLLLPSAGPFAEMAFLRAQLEGTSKGLVAALVRSGLLLATTADSRSSRSAASTATTEARAKAAAAAAARLPRKRGRAQTSAPASTASDLPLDLSALPALLRALDATAAGAVARACSEDGDDNDEAVQWRAVLDAAPRTVTVPIYKWHEKVRFTEQCLAADHAVWQLRLDATSAALWVAASPRAPGALNDPIRALVATLKAEADPLRRAVAAEATADLLLLLVDPRSRWAHCEKAQVANTIAATAAEAGEAVSLSLDSGAAENSQAQARIEESVRGVRNKWAAAAHKLLGNLCSFVGAADSVAAPHRRAGACAALQALARLCGRSSGGGASFFARFPNVASRVVDGLVVSNSPDVNALPSGSQSILAAGSIVSTASVAAREPSTGKHQGSALAPSSVADPQAALTSLHLVSVLAPCVTSADDRRQLAGIAPTVAAYALDSPLAVIREAAASATAALLRSCGGHDATRDESSFAAMGPLLLAAVRDVCNDDRRHAAVVLLARCVAALGISGLCKHLPSLFPAALAAVNDPVHATRRLAAQVFSTVVQLAPLAPADDLRALRAHDTQGSESQRGVLAHLVLGLPLPPQFGARELAACLQPGVTLRPYQTEGVGWLLFLLRAGLHGALCDEMGLGKTLQVLAAVSLHWATDGDGDAGSSRSETSSACQSSAASSRHRRPRHCLVVCPATLVRHWTAEAATFLHPRTLGHRGSRAVALEGSKAQRAKLLTSLLAKQLNADARPGTSSRSSRMRPPKNGSDTGSDSGSGDSESGGSSFGGGFMVVASYDCLRTDGALLAQVPWDVLVLDEAHTAAHASGSSRLFQAARHLRARHRLALTGTPVQNGAGDLWALFDFLMPGFLGTRAEFRRRYGGGAHGGGSTAASYGPGGRHGALAPEQILALEDLHRRVMPFLLRREKAGVLRDLPPKVFVDVPCPLSALQATLYRNVCAAAAAAAAGGSAAGIAQAEEDELDRNDEDDRDNAESMAENASASGGAGGSVGDPLGFGRRRGQRDWPQAWRGVRALRTLSLLCSHPCLAVKTATDAAAGSSSRGQALRGSGGGETQATVSHPRYDEWRTDDAASSKFQALKALLEQLGFCAGVRPTSQGQSALSKRRRRGHCTAAVGEGIEGMEDKDAEDDDKEGGASRDGGNVEGEEEDEEEEEEEEEEGEVRNVSPPQKFILFAQNRSTLDLVQECVFSRFFPSAALLRIDGQVPAAQRVALAKRFCSDPTVAGLLLTTRVGGLGLNLSAAATCFFLEHDWNPMADLQAMDRAHRIGQVGTLTVYRLYAPGTVEARVLGVAATKAAVAHAIVNAENSDALALGTDRVLDLVGASGGSGGGSGAGRGGGGVLSGESADERALAAAARGRFQDHLSGAGSGSGGAVAASGSSEQAAPTGDDGADAQVEAQYFELSVDAFLAHNRPRD